MNFIAFGFMSLSLALQAFANYNNLLRIKDFKKEIKQLKQELQEARAK